RTTVNGTSGADTLVGANITNIWTLTSATGGNLNGIVFSNITALAGGTGSDTLVGANLANAWQITGSNAGSMGSLAFTGMENLTGGTANDTFAFTGSASITGNLDGGLGTNGLDYSGYATGVTVNLLSGVAAGVSGTLANIQNVTGSLQNDSLTGNAAVNVINGNGGVDTLAGGDGNDSIILGATQG